MIFDDALDKYIDKFPDGLNTVTVDRSALERQVVIDALTSAIDRGRPLTDDEWWALFGGPPPPGAVL